MSCRRITAAVDVLRNGATLKELVFAQAPSVFMSDDAEIKMCLQGTFLHDPAVDYLNDYLHPRLIIDGVSYPLGVYAISTVEGQHDNGVLYDKIEAYDLSLILKQTKAETRLHFSAGTPYLAAVSGLLTQAGIKTVISDSNSDALQTDREDWEMGESYLTIINALLAEINYNPIWFDLTGAARLHKYIEPSAAGIARTYRSGISNIRTSVSTQLDIYDAPNVFIAMMDNPDYDGVIIKTAENNDVSSALSIPRRGRRILAPVIKVDNIASAAALQEHVDNIRMKSMLSTETAQFQTDLNPVHGVGDILGVEHEFLQGIYQETYWSMTLEAGAQMHHKVKKVAYV